MFFDFLDMEGSYEERCVGRYDDENVGLVVSTASVNDGRHPFETGIQHPEYHDGRWIIVEAYDTKKDAKAGHKQWEKAMTAKELPKQLVDCCNAEVGQMLDEVSKEGWNVFPRMPA